MNIQDVKGEGGHTQSVQDVNVQDVRVGKVHTTSISPETLWLVTTTPRREVQFFNVDSLTNKQVPIFISIS